MEKNKFKKCFNILVIFLVFVFCISFSLKVNAEEKGEKENELNYSEEYKEYLKLSDEDKAKVEVIPRKYNIPLDSLYENTIPIKELSIGAGKQYINNYVKNIPNKFDLRDKIDIQVENQLGYGLCWDFASMKSLETNLALSGLEFDFSELHVDYLESNLFGRFRELHDGGNFGLFLDYLTKEYGPVLETEVPYDAVYSEEDYDYLLGLEPKAYVYETIDFPTINKAYNEYTEENLELFKAKVKQHIMENGSLYCSVATPDGGTEYFNSETNAEFFTGDWSQCIEGRVLGHAVSIIGWDDNYSRENFNENQRPEKDGAYIVLNSWGDDWGDNGVYYVSYEDYEIGANISGIVSAEVDEGELEEIKFKDRNLYESIKEKMSLRKRFDDSQMSIDVSKSMIEKITYLSLDERNISDLSGLEHFCNLRSLDLRDNKLSSLEPIKELENLEMLTINNCNITHLPDMSSLKNLTTLSLANNDIDNVEEISKLEMLEYLDLSNCNLEECPDMSSFKNLTTLSLANNDIDNVEEISKLEMLEYLDLSNCNLEECPDFSGLTNLVYLDLSDNSIKNGSFNVEWLNLSDCEIDNSILEKFDFGNTKTIVLNDNNITDISVLSNYNLEGLELDNNPISDVSCLTSLEYLSLNGVKNVKGIDCLINLEEIEINDCELTDISFLKNLKKLYSVGIDNNNISDLSPLIDLPCLEDIYASNNNISYIPDELDCAYIDLENQQVSLNINEKLEVGKEVRIDLNQIFSYDKAIELSFSDEPIEVITVDCSVDINNKLVSIKPKKVGQSNVTITVKNGIFKDSSFEINYSAIDSKVSIEPYLFDAKYYANNNPDVKKAFGNNENNLKNHYYNWGIKEGRIASPVFDVNFYINNYPDIKNAFKNDYYGAFYHFINFGIYEGRQGSNEFDVKYYINRYPDIASYYNSDYVSCLIHYVCFGKKERRIGSEEIDNNNKINSFVSTVFDKDLYYSLYPDLQKAIGNNESALKEHFKNYGIAEGRICSYIVDPVYYLNKYSDLKNVYGNNYKDAFIHFIIFGYKEERCASQMFDVKYYKNNNSDVVSFFGQDNLAIINHFISCGIREGRISSQEFNVKKYKKNNFDVDFAYKFNWKQYYWHYMVFGKKEGRICK